jgi:cytochrome c-type protein NapB
VIQRVVLIISAMVAMGGAIQVMQRSAVPVGVDREPAGTPISTGPAIPSEAAVFRSRPGMFAVDADARRRPDAHPRTLATYRLLRSYPGAPPRVPHGLTATEFRTNRCNTCHQQGGYSQRFNAYVPVNPHPEREQCLQCHATNDALVGVPFPQASPNDACRQCHSSVPARFEEEDRLDWVTTAFPTLSRRGSASVPSIPHPLEWRGDCLACHMGPGAVAEIRVSHPELANCRQCHVLLDADAGAFERPLVDRRTGGAQ